MIIPVLVLLVLRAARAAAWHGWAAAELAAALAFLAAAAGARADTAKAYATENRLDSMARRNWTWASMAQHTVGNYGNDRLSGTLSIPAGQATPGSEYEIRIEGTLHWSNTSPAVPLRLTIKWGTQEFATCTIPQNGLAQGTNLDYRMRGAVTISGDGEHCSASLTGSTFAPGGGQSGASNVNFGNVVNNHAFSAAAGNLSIWAQWLENRGDGGTQITSMKTTITRRGA